MHVVSRIAITSAIVTLLGAVQVSSAESGDALARKKACLSCHKIDQKVVGPAFKDIAKKYRGTPGAEAKIAAKIRQGSKGDWGGPMAMPAQSALSNDDVKALAAWVLSLADDAQHTAAGTQH